MTKETNRHFFSTSKILALILFLIFRRVFAAWLSLSRQEDSEKTRSAVAFYNRNILANVFSLWKQVRFEF